LLGLPLVEAHACSLADPSCAPLRMLEGLHGGAEDISAERETECGRFARQWRLRDVRGVTRRRVILPPRPPVSGARAPGGGGLRRGVGFRRTGSPHSLSHASFVAAVTACHAARGAESSVSGTCSHHAARSVGEARGGDGTIPRRRAACSGLRLGGLAGRKLAVVAAWPS